MRTSRIIRHADGEAAPIFGVKIPAGYHDRQLFSDVAHTVDTGPKPDEARLMSHAIEEKYA